MINNCKIPGYDYSFDFHKINSNIFSKRIKLLNLVKVKKKNINFVKESRLEKHMQKKDTD